MTKQTKLAKAIAYVIAGAALSSGAVSVASADVTTMYNLTTHAGNDNSTNTTDPVNIDPAGNKSWGLWNTGTDGWIYEFGNLTIANPAKWAGTASTYATPFDYTGQHLNWGMEITGGKGGSGIISTYDAHDKYGVYADIDAAKGAWSATNTGSSFGGWRHDLDTGLFKSDTTGLVTLSVSGIISEESRYGFTVFQGMDSVTGYNHHGQWNNNNWVVSGVPGGVLAGTGLTVNDIIAHSIGDKTSTLADESANLNSIQFNAQAGQIYTIFLGGYRDGAWVDTVDGYKLTVSQVPVPSAVWLFGSALAGFIGVKRRKKAVI